MLAANSMLSHYRILSRLGAGGMGEVYLAEDTSLGRKVALKILSAEFTQREDRMRRFAQEARAASALNHPSILTIHEIGQAGDVCYIATEYVDGVTLRKRLAAGRMPPGQAVDVAAQVAGALAEAHAAGIIHRDIKPDNLMIRPNGLVKVLDFGLAKLVEEPGSRTPGPDSETATAAVDTEAGHVVGTPHYMSPEQARGLKVDTRTDIFSLGVVLYEMIAGRRPFEGDTSSHAIVGILEKEPVPLQRYVPEIPEELQRIVAKALEKDREERYQVVKDLQIDLKRLKQKLDLEPRTEPSATAFSTPPPGSEPARAVSSAEYIVSGIKRHRKAAAFSLLALALAAAAVLVYVRRAPALTDKDTILLADFVNTTGDAVFDDTLKQGLAAQLEQSPFLSILADGRIRETLRLMSRQADDRITNEIGREICQRLGVKALIEGSIDSLGSHYVLTLQAVNAATGDNLTRLQVEAESKERVLHELGSAATQLRRKLGESLASIEKYDTPLAQATTSSLDALKAFSMARQKNLEGDFRESARYAKRATQLDPNFADAYRMLSVDSTVLGEMETAHEAAIKAFELRGRASERERLMIEGHYYEFVTGDTERSIESMESATQTYPRYYVAWQNLGVEYWRTGQYEKAVAAYREAIQLVPNAVTYFTLAGSFTALGRLSEAKETCAQAASQRMEGTNGGCHFLLYAIAFVSGDTAETRRQLEWAAAQPDQSFSPNWQRDAATFQGQLRQAREFAGHVLEDMLRRNSKDPAADLVAGMASDQAVAGQCQQAGQDVQGALALAHTVTALESAGFASALCGDATRTLSIAGELAKLRPRDSALNEGYLPCLRALSDTRGNHPASNVQGFAGPAPAGGAFTFAPAFCRGEVYLGQRKGAEAAAEFQKILDHRGWDTLSILYPAAYLGLARAAALTGDLAKSRKAYQDLFAAWKDADPDLPALVDARREYEKVRFAN